MKSRQSRSLYLQHGSMTLYLTLVILPLLFVGYAISLDISRYHNAQNIAQHDLDSAALVGARALPYRLDAESAVRSFLAAHSSTDFGGAGEGVAVETTGDSISVRFIKEIKSPFFSFISNLTGETHGLMGLRTELFSRARIDPFDTFIAMDATASYLAPSYLINSPWGNAVDWPAASFFEFDHSFVTPTGTIDPRVASQQCWNAPFVAIKQATLSIYDYLSSIDRDQVGLGVYPGFGKTLDVLRGTRARNDPSATSTAAESQFINYYNTNRGDIFCLAAAERETQTPLYQFPGAGAHLSEWRPSTQPPSTIVFSPQWTLNQAYEPYFGAHQTVWATVARDEAPAAFPDLFEQATTEAVGATLPASRGGLIASPKKYVFLISGNLPFIAGTRWSPGMAGESAITAAITALRDRLTIGDLASFNMQLKFIYIVFDHEGIAANQVAPFIAPLQALFSSAAAVGAGGSSPLSMQVYYAQNADVLQRTLIPSLMLGERNAVLSK